MNKEEKRVLGAHKIGMESRGPSSLPFSLLGFVSWLRWRRARRGASPSLTVCACAGE
jgi:hypothetical protein